MPPAFQVQCCVNGKSKNYVSFTYCHPSGTERGWQLTDRTECWNYYRTPWSFQIDHITSCPCCQSISACHSFSLPNYLLFPSLHFLKNAAIYYIHTRKHTQLVTHICPPCFAWTWPQFINILPLVHPLCRYNDHLTVKSKARRKLGRRQQRGQQHWTNYVPFSPSILTLMKSLIISGRGRWGGVDRCIKCTLDIYLKMKRTACKNNVKIKSRQQVRPSHLSCVLRAETKKGQKDRWVCEKEGRPQCITR